MDSIVLTKPDDMHCHFRDGAMLRLVAPFTAGIFRRALVMPNVPEITTAARALAYRDEIRRATEGFDFDPLLTLKLTHKTTPKDIEEAHAVGMVACKVYPAGVTVGSHDGIRDLGALGDVFRAMDTTGMVLCIHAEQPGAFILDREKIYLEKVQRLASAFPSLKVVIEHISTRHAVRIVRDGPPNLAATITPVHLTATLDDVLGDGLHPHNFMYPVPKHPEDREELISLATSGHSFVFAGTDSAPHLRWRKESPCGCAGAFSAPVALSVYTKVFEEHGGPDWVEKLAAFVGRNGADFYGLPRNEGTITLLREPWMVPNGYYDAVEDDIGAMVVVPFLAGETLDWRVEQGHRG